VDLLRFIPGYQQYIYDDGKETLLLLLLSFLITFAITRAYTRGARIHGWGSAHVGGVHMHHVVPGLLLMLGAGLTEFAVTPENDVYTEILAIAFGAGAALAMDEFAMVLHLDDVYWSPEGRGSVDAVVTLTILMLLLFTATAPLGASSNDAGAALWSTIASNGGLAVVTFIKGKLKLAILSVVFPLFGLFGAIRLAKPGSLWAKRFYDPSRGRRAERKALRAEQRAAVRRRRYDALRTRLYDAIGGAPTNAG
jgi:hypothetical protein